MLASYRYARPPITPMRSAAMPRKCVMPMFPALASFRTFALIAVALGAMPAAAAPLSGTFSSPLGKVALTEKDGTVTAKLVDAKNPCGFPKGKVILEGSRLDDSVVGTVHACKEPSETCMGPVDGAAMLLITRAGGVMSGAVHVEAGACPTVLKGDSVVFKKAGAGAAAKQPGADKAGGTPRQRAEKLAAEAAKIMNENEGNAEAARTKFQEAVAADATYAEGYIGVGVTYYVRERYPEALDWYKKALEANPANGDAYYNIGCIYALTGESEQALRYLRIALLNGYVQLNTLASDGDLKNLQGNEAFEKLKQGITD